MLKNMAKLTLKTIRKLLLRLIYISVLISCSNPICMDIPKAKKIPRELTIHNDIRIDNYFWLKERGAKEVEDYLNSENEYTKCMLKQTEGFQEKVYKEIVGRIKQTDMSVPYKENGYYYYTRYEEGREYPVYCRKKESLEAREEILLNVNDMARGYDYYNVAGFTVSPDNKTMAFGVDTVGRRLYTIYFKDIATGEVLIEKLENTSGRATWANNNKTVFYTIKDDNTLRPFQVCKSVLGDLDKHEIVFQENDDTFYSFVYKSRSKKYIIIGSSSTVSDEYRILEADTPNSEFRLFQGRERGLEYAIGHFENKFYIKTNYDAENFRLMETPEGKTAKENWKEVIAHREDVFLESFMAFKEFLVIDERIKGISQLRIINQNSGDEHYIDFEEDAFTAWISVNPEFDTELLRVGFTSLTTPISTYDYNMNSKEKVLLKRQEVVGGYDPKDYKSERLYVKTRDGIEVPVSLVYKRKIKPDRNTPLLLYGYGSYGTNMDPYFSSTRLSLLDRGFVYAIAHVRGGQVLGRKWYEDGKLLKKKNTFNDFIDCAKYLIRLNYTSERNLFAKGGSAGGLLMGAVVNLEPELFKGVIASVPFVDVVTTMLDDSIPLTTGEYDEWGNPNEKEYYEYMLSYSPYDNVEKKDYPNILVTAGYHDSQVQYWEPAKWVAKLRELKTDDNIVLLHTNMDAGHSGVSGRFKQYKETALEYIFLFVLMGIKE